MRTLTADELCNGLTKPQNRETVTSFRYFLALELAMAGRKSKLPAPVLARLEQLRTFDTSEQLRFLPTDEKILRLQEDPGIDFGAWCKFHGPSCKEDNAALEDSTFRFHAVKFHLKRCLFSTRDGRLGLGPRTMRAGGAVYLVAGTRTPYILPGAKHHEGNGATEKGWKFISKAYVHGILYGEAADGLQEVDWSNIELE